MQSIINAGRQASRHVDTSSQPCDGCVDLISHREKCSSANEFFFPTEGGFFLCNNVHGTHGLMNTN